MKIYGYIKVMSEGFGDGTEGDVSLHTDKEELLKSAYEDYKANLEYYREDETLDDDYYEVYDDFEDFKTELLNGYINLQAISEHIQYEYFEREVE